MSGWVFSLADLNELAVRFWVLHGSFKEERRVLLWRKTLRCMRKDDRPGTCCRNSDFRMSHIR